eukprot:CAMPEP_0202900980 /NCGR_PEP_ID=MMETSP1392-20130828/12582_1 /ASSEMBLY_ACC=CAM_ASM_000868 /TAXON_ID=225041 /ORGANISM="Chlamydomonas chlamydogama, Strain SAG 11-48b" /LENGTH=200 /DNA_ID=CAMNT_0049587459 /DNA_START=73 /DNA_END=671 /DNA_ORIENTATION=-
MKAQILVALAIASAFAGVSARNLLATELSFPFWTCEKGSYLPDVSPYTLSLYSIIPVGTNTKFCFQIGSAAKASDLTDIGSECYDKLQASLYKMSIESSPACSGAIKAVTVNGAPTFNWQFHTYASVGGAEIRITKLNKDSNTAPGSIICITATAPCKDLGSLAKTSDASFYYSFSESSAHRCCPVNVNASSSPPPLPPP